MERLSEDGEDGEDEKGWEDLVTLATPHLCSPPPTSAVSSGNSDEL